LRLGWGRGSDLDKKGTVDIGYQSGSRTRYAARHYSSLVNSVIALGGEGDYYDYYWSRGARLQATYRFDRPKVEIRAEFGDEKHTSLRKNSDFDLLGRRQPRRENPGVDPGRLRWVEWGVRYGEKPRGHAGLQTEIEIEYSSDGGWVSDFIRYGLEINWRL
jgi:hypothetical protein